MTPSLTAGATVAEVGCGAGYGAEILLNLRRLLSPALESIISSMLRRPVGGSSVAPAPAAIYRLEIPATDAALDLFAVIL